MDRQEDKLNDASQTQQNNSKNESSKSHSVLAMALTASLAVLALFIATFMLLQLKFKEPIEITLSDWLKMILPIVGGALVVIFAFLGVDRLKNFDERQDKLAKDLRNDLNIQVDNAVKLVQPRLEETYQEWEASLKQRLSEYDKSFNQVSERINKFNSIMGSVEKLEEISVDIGNVEEAHQFVVALFSEPQSSTSDKSQRTNILRALVERIKSGDITGDSADYHNTATELARQNYFELASEVARKGHNTFRDNFDLLSDFIYYSHKGGRTDNDVKNVMMELEEIEKKLWNWRTFTFYIDVINDGPANDENKEKVLQCIHEYKKALPDDERAYMAEYETYRKYGESELAEKALVTAENCLAMTAQCSLTLSEIYHKRGEYDKAINSADRAILGQAETQPSSSTGATFAHRGFSRDAKIHKAILEGMEVDAQYADIHSAISDYKMAIKLGYAHPNIAVRLKILQELLPAEVQENASVAELEERIDKLEFTLGLLLEKLTSDDEE